VNGPPPNSAAISPKRCDCSATDASVPWNSRNSIGVSARPSLECRLIARTCSASSNSMRAMGMPDWMVAMAVLQQASTDGNGQVPPEIASGMPDSFSVSWVMMPSVPSDPTISRVRS
jgi:hypothetical protein